MGRLSIIIVCLHVLFCLFAMLGPKSWVHSTRLTSLYDRLIILGPFFQEARIRSTPRLFIAYKTNGSWSGEIDHSIESFRFYREHPWRYDQLHTGDFERSVSFDISRLHRDEFQNVKNVRGFRELNEFILQERIKKPVDSVRLLYGFNVYLPDINEFRFDTLFQYAYDPSHVAPAKR